MSKFNEESLLLIRNYDAYQDIVNTGKNLTPTIRSLFPEIKKRLRNQAWWSPKWEIWSQQDYPDSIQFSFCEKVDGDRLIWVIVENLTPDSFFGNSDSPFMSLYICDNDKRKDVIEEMQRIIRDGSDTWMGEFPKPKPQNSYAVQKNMSKCLPEEIDGFKDIDFGQWLEDSIFTQFAEFSEFYSKYFDQFNKVAIKYSKYNK